MSNFQLPDLSHLPVDQRLDALEKRSCNNAAANRRATWFIVFLAFLLTILFAYSIIQSYEGRVNLVDNQRAGCIRGKLDRSANAQAFRAQSTYLQLVLQAQSVRRDVKSAALVNQNTQDATATELEQRARINCSEEYPSPSLSPFAGD